jgi:hypothetical protein
MSANLSRFALAFALVGAHLLAGCGRADREDFAIHWRKHSYEKWLIQQRPILASLPKSAIFAYDFTTYHSSPVLPVIEYDLKAGNWDGILELWFILKLDAKGNPIGMQEETVTFVRLPAHTTVTTKEGKKRNVYWGVKLPPAEASAAIKRAMAGGDFSDYRKIAEESGGLSHSLFDYNDPWKKLREK